MRSLRGTLPLPHPLAPALLSAHQVRHVYKTCVCVQASVYVCVSVCVIWLACDSVSTCPCSPSGLEVSVAIRQVLHTLAVMGPLLTDFLYLVIPGILRVAEKLDLPVVVRRHAVDCLGRFCRDMAVSGEWVHSCGTYVCLCVESGGKRFCCRNILFCYLMCLCVPLPSSPRVFWSHRAAAEPHP